MLYIKIGNKKYPCKIESFHTQFGSNAIRVISAEAPTARKGFKIYDDEILLGDYSDYTFVYRTGDTVKEYTQNEEEIIVAESYSSGVPESPIQKQINSINNRITSITPYEETKTAYFGEIEKVFYGVPSGVLTVHMDDDFTVQKVEDRVYIHFDRLTTNKEITITVQ